MSNAEIAILVVENDPLQVRMLKLHLQELGYTLAGVARTAEEAEELFAELQPDLVVLDIHLDGPRDGISTAEALMRYRRVPLIFITSFPDAPTFARARQVGPFAFLRNPYDDLLLGHSIELALQHFALAQGESQAAQGASEMADGTVLFGGIFVRQQRRFVKVSLAQLLVLETDDGYTHLHTTARRKFTLRQSLAELLPRLPAATFVQVPRRFAVQPAATFVQVPRRFAVQPAAIESFDPQRNEVQVGEHRVPVSRSARRAGGAAQPAELGRRGGPVELGFYRSPP